MTQLPTRLTLLYSDRLGKIAREIDVEAFSHSEPIRHELERDDVKKPLKGINRAGYLDSLGLRRWKLLVTLGANDYGTAFASDNCRSVSKANRLVSSKD